MRNIGSVGSSGLSNIMSNIGSADYIRLFDVMSNIGPADSTGLLNVMSIIGSAGCVGLFNGVSNILQNHCLTGSRRRNNQRALAFADWRNQVDNTCSFVLNRRIFDFHLQPLIRVKWSKVIKVDFVFGLIRIFEVDQ